MRKNIYRFNIILLLLVFTITVIISGCSKGVQTSADTKLDLSALKQIDGMTQLTDNVLVSQGQYEKVNMTLVISGKEAAIIDAGNDAEEGQRIKDYLDKNGLQVKYIFITHEHSDHKRNLKMFSDYEAAAYYYDSTTDNEIFKLGDKSFKIIYTPGHARDKHMSIEIVEDSILISGDVIATNLPPLAAFEGTVLTQKNTLENLSKDNYKYVIPGHGDIENAGYAVNRHLEYIDNATKLAEAKLKEGASMNDISSIPLEDCIKDMEGIDLEFSKNVHIQNMRKLYYELKEKQNK